ncbi:MAG: aspartyl/asparaginyl beta-hydroxylase domain-containing protein [Pseudomonadota bacterium]
MSIDRPQPAFDEDEANRRLTSNNRDATAMLAKADNRMLDNDHRAADAYYKAALQLLDQQGQRHSADASRAMAAHEWINQRYVDHMILSIENAGHPRGDWHPRFARSLAMMIGQVQRPPEYRQYPQNPMTFFYADMAHVEFAPREIFKWAQTLEEQTAAIRAEGENLLKDGSQLKAYVKKDANRPQGDVHGMLENDDWSSFELSVRGEFDPERVKLCPATYAALRKVPLCDITGRAPTPMFSRLSPGKRIPPHTGMINVRYICHLPLIVPGEGALRVGNSQSSWTEGELMVFDDSVEHEAWNSADNDRLVLIFDVWRPELEQAERDQLNALFAAVDSY